ncbi:MAG TPA: methyltransferase domain-containing protein [Myxococcales bacterium]|nr:methyltransferase domain-containing protein [Myxococcales bacterium]
MSFQLQIESLAYGGAGVGRREGRAVFVDGAAPGDRLEVELTRARTRPERARLLSVLEAGAARVEPRCPHYGDCGGCQWQHVTPEAQLEAKRRALEDALVRIGKIPRGELPPVRARGGPAWRYRRRARFAVAADGRLGFAARGSRRIVPVGSCALLEPDLEALALDLSGALAAEPCLGLGHVELVATAGKGAAELQLDSGASFDAACRRAAALLAALPALAGVVVTQGSRTATLGEPLLQDGEQLLGPHVFAQASREGNALLRGAVLDALALRDGERVLELHCGSGNFTFALARAGAQVVAVEAEAAALALARRALPSDLAARVTFVEAAAAAALRDLGRSRAPFDAALLDPPRAGAKDEMALLAPLGAHRIVYVSCDPATLARDVGTLRALGFRATQALALDLFAQTYHLEAVVTLERA